MTETENKPPLLPGIIRWSARILCILSILFMSLFALDAFSSGTSIWLCIGGFLIHMIPSFIIAAVLVLAWKNELPGGILLLLIGVFTAVVVFKGNYKNPGELLHALGIVAAINLPFIASGGLFIFSHFLHRIKK